MFEVSAAEPVGVWFRPAGAGDCSHQRARTYPGCREEQEQLRRPHRRRGRRQSQGYDVTLLFSTFWPTVQLVDCAIGRPNRILSEQRN